MVQIETITGALILRDDQVAGVEAALRSEHGRLWLTFQAPTGTLWLGNVVELVVVGLRPRIISARILSRDMDESGGGVDRFEAVVEHVGTGSRP